MATERLFMRQIREILRQKLILKHSHRLVAGSLKVSIGAVSSTVSRTQALGLTWDQIQALSDEELESKLYGPPVPPGTAAFWGRPRRIEAPMNDTHRHVAAPTRRHHSLGARPTPRPVAGYVVSVFYNGDPEESCLEVLCAHEHGEGDFQVLTTPAPNSLSDA